MVHAPWSDEQVASLRLFQECGLMHPFTGVNSAGNKVVLIPTNAGWIAEDGGPIVQDWAHQFMLDWKHATMESWLGRST